MPTRNLAEPKKYHPTHRRKVVATADVCIQQVQVIDKDGRDRSIVLWRCGPDIVFSETMDGLFDNDRRFKAPKWLVEQMKDLPPSRQFDVFGVAKTGTSAEAPEPLTLSASESLPEGMADDDAPGIKSA